MYEQVCKYNLEVLMSNSVKILFSCDDDKIVKLLKEKDNVSYRCKNELGSYDVKIFIISNYDGNTMGKILVDKMSNFEYVQFIDNKANPMHEILRGMRFVVTDFLCAKGYVRLHCSTFCINECDGIVIVGDKGAGKTTILLEALKRPRVSYVTNDLLFYNPETQNGIGWIAGCRIERNTINNIINGRKLCDRYGVDLSGKITIPFSRIPQDLETQITFSTQIKKIFFIKKTYKKTTKITRLEGDEIAKLLLENCILEDKKHDYVPIQNSVNEEDLIRRDDKNLQFYLIERSDNVNEYFDDFWNCLIE